VIWPLFYVMKLLDRRTNIPQSAQAKSWESNRQTRATLLVTSEAALKQLSVFEYCYCDASNFKAWGSVLLQGSFTTEDVKLLTSRFESEEFFIAEQLGLPPLYAELWAISHGPSEADHVWHSFEKLRPVEARETGMPVFDTVEKFFARIEKITHWDQKQSPHWDNPY
jgi:hypothetical protein